jgi:predicted DNA binding protein
MWNLRFKVKNVDNVYSYLTEKYDVIDYFYPVDRYRKGKKIHILSIHVLEGSEDEKDKFARELKKNKKVEEFERDEDRIVVLVREEEKFYDLLYDPMLYFPSPVLIKDGYGYWNVAAWNRNVLTRLVDEMEKWKDKLLDFELLALEKKNLKDIYFPRILPDVPDKQQLAFQLAVENGYYKFPRNVPLGHLAKIMGVSTQTFHEHLRKAEAKLLPYFSEHVGKVKK